MNQLCDICETEVATICCLDCKKTTLLCQECSDSKHSKEATKKHKFKPYNGQEDLKAQEETKSLSHAKCPIHKKELSLFCKQDKVTVCEHCIIFGPHKHHEALYLKDAEEMVKICVGELDPKTQRIYSLCNNANYMQQTLGYYEMNNNKFVKTSITATFKYAYCFQIDARIFIVGGFDVNDLKEYIENSNTLISKANLNFKRCYMGICKINKHSFCVIGGDDANYAMSRCEMYNLIYDNWKNMPNLNDRRFYCGCTLFNQTILYCFGGKNESNAAVNTIESLDISKDDNIWKKLDLNENYLSSQFSFQINESTILIFSWFGDLYEFDVSTLKVKKNNAIKITDDNFEEPCYKIGNSVYCIGVHSILHQYNLKTGTYSSLKGV